MDTYYGIGEVAKVLGVKPQTLYNWKYRRGGKWPVPPTVRVLGERRDGYGWRREQMPDWIRWASARRRQFG